ncbi:hypothetical protein ASZ90_015006 [hydrocarbon metagenome]|uniref:Uncharacterized protein n=1 Tax=hydrocarbon metagenome TaxID=938273 RepID=A0A0W8F422_9ZZZZ
MITRRIRQVFTTIPLFQILKKYSFVGYNRTGLMEAGNK